MSPGQVCVAGEIFVDLLMIGIDSWPEPGKEIFASEFRREIGGGTAITACALAQLESPVELLVTIGKDSSDWIFDRLRSFGVQTSNVVVDETEPTGFTVIASRPEDRAFITYAGANRRFPDQLQNWLQSSKVFPRHVHISAPLSLDTAPEVIARIHHRGATVSLDVGWQKDWLSNPRAWDAVRDADIFFPNHAEGQAMTGKRKPAEILEAFPEKGVKRVALKLGAEGAAIFWDGEISFEPPYRVDCVDTTGAGDCFDAGFLHAFLSGADHQTCLRMANICGALSTEAYGGIAGAPDRHRVEQALGKIQL